MPGRYESRIWQSDGTRDAPPRHRRACRYEVHVPERLGALEIRLDGALAALVSEAEQALIALNTEGGPALSPLARLLLRTESIASSKVEGLQLGVRDLARAEAKAESGPAPGATAREVLANIDAMVLAVESAAERAHFDEDGILAIHRRLLERTAHQHIAGRFRDSQNWIGGNNYTPCGAAFVPPSPDMVAPLLRDLCQTINTDLFSPVVQAALVHAQFSCSPAPESNTSTGSRASGMTAMTACAPGSSTLPWPPVARLASPVRTSRRCACCRRRGARSFGRNTRGHAPMPRRGRSSTICRRTP